MSGPKNIREAAEDMVLASDDGTEYEHNDGCQGEPDCPACWVQGIRRLIADFPDETATVANHARVTEVIREAQYRRSPAPAEYLAQALLAAGVFRDEATVKAEALAEAVAAARHDATRSLTNHGRCENNSIADWIEDHARTGAA